MNKFIFMTFLTALIITNVAISADEGDCNSSCTEEHAQCYNRCMVMAADNTACIQFCERQLTECNLRCDVPSNEGKIDEPEPERKPILEEYP